VFIISVRRNFSAFPVHRVQHNKKQNKLVAGSMNRLTRRMRNF